MERIAKFRQSGGIALFPPEARLVLHKPDPDVWFTGPKIIAGDLMAELMGQNGRDEIFEWTPGIAFTAKGLLHAPAQELEQAGLFDITISLYGLPKNRLVVCRMTLPKTKLVLEGIVERFDDELENDKLLRTGGSLSYWSVPNDPREYWFFTPADPQILSQLRFSFTVA